MINETEAPEAKTEVETAAKEATVRAVAAPEVRPGNAAKPGFDIVGTLAMFIVPIAIVAMYHFSFGGQGREGATAGAPVPTTARGIVVVDAQAALRAFMATVEQRMAAGEDFTEAQLHLQGADFGAEFLRAVSRYRDAGYIVLDKGQVLGVPVTADITEDIAAALGIDLDMAFDNFGAATLGGR